MAYICQKTEPLWDYFLVDKEKTTARLSVNRIEKKETIFEHKMPHGREIFYPVIFKDGDIYRMYYGTGHRFKDPETGKFNESHTVTCYAESRDGKTWEFPSLGIYGDNNIILSHPTEPYGGGLCVFRDDNPACPPESRYKGIMRVEDGCKVFAEGGTLASFVSPDGIHFERVENIAKEPGKFDSLNTVYWDEADGEYKLFYRDFDEGRRHIKLMTSKDYKHWEKHGFIQFDDEAKFALYTNNVQRYPGAPHVFTGLPVRYDDHGENWTPSFDVLPDIESRKWRFGMHPRFGTTLTDTLFMTSRDGFHWHKFNEAVADGGYEAPLTWKYGDGYFSQGYIVDETEISMYSTDSSWDGDYTGFVRYAIRRDGFASFKSGWEKSTLVTKPLILGGDKFFLNFRTSAAGTICIKITDGETVATSCEVFGNHVRREVVFDKPLSIFEGREVTIEIEMQDAEIFAIGF